MKSMHIVLLVLLSIGVPGVAWAQAAPISDTDVYQLNYFDNANSGWPDAFVRISNPGTTYTVTTAPIDGDICAMIYVFRPDQELTECCGCRVTPNALLKLSVNKNLTANPLSGTPHRPA